MYSVKNTGKSLSIPHGVAIGVGYAITVTLLGSLLTAKIIDNLWLAQENIGYAIMIILLIAAWTGSATASAKTKRRKAMVVLITGLLFYLVLLVMTALFFGGQYDGAGETGVLILAGSILPIFEKRKRPERKISRKHKIHNR